MSLKIRPYHSADQLAVLRLFRSNTPRFFDPTEENHLVEYLQNELEDYFVVEINDEIVGAGGINYFLGNRLARISWDVVHFNFQGDGVGSHLTQYRIDYLLQNNQIDFIEVRTSQFTYEFYQKMGFKLERIVTDYWAKGFDLYHMRLMKSLIL